MGRRGPSSHRPVPALLCATAALDRLTPTQCCALMQICADGPNGQNQHPVSSTQPGATHAGSIHSVRHTLRVPNTAQRGLTQSLQFSPSPAGCPGRCGRGRASCPGCDCGRRCPTAGQPCPPRAVPASQRDRPSCADDARRGVGSEEILLKHAAVWACRGAEAADTGPVMHGACVTRHRSCVHELADTLYVCPANVGTAWRSPQSLNSPLPLQTSHV